MLGQARLTAPQVTLLLLLWKMYLAVLYNMEKLCLSFQAQPTFGCLAELYRFTYNIVKAGSQINLYFWTVEEILPISTSTVKGHTETLDAKVLRHLQLNI